MGNAANEVWYTLGALAHNLLRAVQILHMNDDKQKQRIRQLIRWWMTVPVKLSRHAGRTRARYFVPHGALDWWRVILRIGVNFQKRKILLHSHP